MTFLEAVVIPFVISISANIGYSKGSDFLNNLKAEDKELKKLFTNSIIETIKDTKSNFIIEKSIISILIDELKKDDTKLFIAIKNICDKKNKNFLNILEDKENNEFTKELFCIYSIDISNVKENSFYDNVIKDLLLNYKKNFFKHLKTQPALNLIFQEVLKLDKINESVQEIKSLLAQGTKNNNDTNQQVSNIFKPINFKYLEQNYSAALTCIGLGEKHIYSCPSNQEYIDDVITKLNLTNLCIIKGVSGSGKSLLTYQIAKKYHDNEWNVYKLNKPAYKEHLSIDIELKKSIILIDDSQTLSISEFENLVDFANNECLLLFNWNSSTPVNSNFLSNYPCIEIIPSKQVEMLKEFSLKNLSTIEKVLKTLNVSTNKYYYHDSVLGRIEKASKEKTPWLFNYSLTEGWKAAKNDMELLKNQKRLDYIMAIVAIFQYVSLDNGVNRELIINEVKNYSDDTSWLKEADKVLKEYCLEVDGIVRHKHYYYAKKVLHAFIQTNKDENINNLLVTLFKRILVDSNFEVGYSNILEFIMFNYRYINYHLSIENFPKRMANDLFLKSMVTDDIKIRNLNSLIRFDKSVLEIVDLHLDIVYQWIMEVNRNTAYPLQELINTLINNRQHQLIISVNMMEVVFNKIVESSLIEKSRYSSLYNRLHFFCDVKQIDINDKLKIDISNIKFGITHYHFAKVLSDLGCIEKNWSNECIKNNLDSIAKNLNENLMESYSLYQEILQRNFGLIQMVLNIKTDNKTYNSTARKLARLINIESVLGAFKSLKISEAQNFSMILLFLMKYNKDKFDEISKIVDYEHLKILYKDDFLQEHNHKVIVHVLYNNNNEAYNNYVDYLINNCKYLGSELFVINPNKAIDRLKIIKKYKMHFHGSNGYKVVSKMLIFLDKENEHDLSMEIIRDNYKVIKEAILNTMVNADNSIDKYNFLVYLYKNTPDILRKIFSHVEEVNKLIEKIYKLLRGKTVEKETAKLYALFIKELSTSHNNDIEKLEKRFTSIKQFKIKE